MLQRPLQVFQVFLGVALPVVDEIAEDEVGDALVIHIVVFVGQRQGQFSETVAERVIAEEASVHETEDGIAVKGDGGVAARDRQPDKP